MNLVSRVEQDIDQYTSETIEISPGVRYSQYRTINRIMKFKNRDLAGTKIDEDLRYIYYFDVISPRADSEVKNLRMDTKHILAFSRNPRHDFPAIFITNSVLKEWMEEQGEGDKLNDAVEQFVGNGNVGFKKVGDTYELTDPLNTFIVNQKAETIDDTDVIERHEMTASELVGMQENGWYKEPVQNTIKELKNNTFTAGYQTDPIATSAPRYEIFEFTGEVNEKEYNDAKGIKDGDENKFFLAKVVFAGLRKSKTGQRYILFCDKLKGKMSDHYIYAHRGKYEGRFWRVGMYELLFDHQIRANEIGNQIARGLEWASKVIFRTGDTRAIGQNIQADLINGDVIESQDLQQLDVRMRGLDQLIADWNRLMQDADRLANSLEVVRGEVKSGTPFRLGALINQNAGKMFVVLRQKLAIPYRRVFKEWVIPKLVKDLKAKDIFRITGDSGMVDLFRDMKAEEWYQRNLVRIGPHTKEIADILKEEKKRELVQEDPILKNNKKIWDGVLSRMHITITGENSDLSDQLEDISNLLQLEQDPQRRAFLLDSVYKIRGIPIPPAPTQQRQQVETNQRSQNVSLTPEENDVEQTV